MVSQAHSDSELVEACLDSRPEMYRDLVARYQAPLVAYLTGRLHDAGFADEVAHDAFVRAFFLLAKLRKRGSFFPWLVGIAERVAKEERRRRRMHGALDESIAASPAKETAVSDHALETAVSSLAEPYRDVILLCYYGGLTCAQTAERLGIPLGTVTKRLSRAYAMLRANLKSAEENGKEALR